ncbi:MAG TPA: RNA polymerase subunit sigma-70, partial [Lachnospiraceae bacterium]|nr:RNA polymerase subunit sigma-70 [Lachnospiraceae bacterium]
MQTFQKPFTPEEEQLYLKRYRDGDLEARNMLVERNLRLVAHIARKYQTAEEDMEDLISIGTI